MIKTVIAEVRIKSKHPEKLPDWGLGKGVINRTSYDFRSKDRKDFNSPMFAAALLDKEAELIREMVEVKWTEAKPKRVKRERSK